MMFQAFCSFSVISNKEFLFPFVHKCFYLLNNVPRLYMWDSLQTFLFLFNHPNPNKDFLFPFFSLMVLILDIMKEVSLLIVICSFSVSWWPCLASLKVSGKILHDPKRAFSSLPIVRCHFGGFFMGPWKLFLGSQKYVRGPEAIK